MTSTQRPQSATRQTRLDFDAAKDAATRVSGIVDRIAFHSEETGFSVLRVKDREGRALATVVGRTADVSAGEWIEAEGRYREDPRHGRQFEADEIRISAPTSREGIEHYLASGAVPGIGKGFAKRLVDHFGERVFEVIEHEPERLREIPGVGKARSESISRAFEEQRGAREVMLFLHEHGIGTQRAIRIQKTYGAATLETLRRDPYCLIRDVRGIGFATADAMARSLGFEHDAPSRVRAGIREVLGNAVKQGHCGQQWESVESDAARLLDVPAALVTDALDELVRNRELIREEHEGRTTLFLPELHRAEVRAAARLVELSKGKLPWPVRDTSAAIAASEKKFELTFAPEQREAIERALSSKLMVLTGGPGVGKTTLVRAILELVSEAGTLIQLAAPTGRAAKRLAETTGRSAQTIHRLLEADGRAGGFKRGPQNPIDCELLVVDESSMLDVRLLDALVSAVPLTSAVLFIGDVDQLPSVGPGQVLLDLIESGVVAVSKLTRIFRQAAESRIIQGAHAINAGRLPELENVEGSDFYFIETRDAEDTLARLLRVVGERIEARFGLDPANDVQVLTPMHRGPVGAQNLNIELQRLLNPLPPTQRASQELLSFRPGDKVMQVVNNYDKDVYNGDIGRVESIDAEEKLLEARFDERTLRYPMDELDELTHAYAITIHKSQGSEYPAVVLPIVTDHYVMLRRNLVYTGMTRGRQLVVMLGQRKALEIALRDRGQAERTTRLRDRLRSAAEVRSPSQSPR